VPSVVEPPSSGNATFDRLCAIVDVDVATRAGWAPLDLAAAYLNGGARFLQLRAKALAGGEFLDLASRIRERANAAGASLVVNDRADIARLSGAAGVHVGQDDLSATAVRAIVGSAAVVGLSTHNREQIDRAVLAPVTYIAIGPVFATSTKQTGYEGVGLSRVRDASDRAARHGLSVVAIGGITLERAADVVEAGAASVAVIADLLAGGDPEARVRAYLDRLVRASRV
jgi:thiamine-phosphate pyrophosphorylase